MDRGGVLGADLCADDKDVVLSPLLCSIPTR